MKMKNNLTKALLLCTLLISCNSSKFSHKAYVQPNLDEDEILEKEINSIRNSKEKKPVKEGVYCPNCGEKINNDARFCGKCGRNLTKEESANIPPINKKKDIYALVGFILGLASTIAWIIPIFGYPVTIVGIVFSAKSRGSEKTAFTYIGLYFSIIFLGITFINSVLGVLLSINETSYVDYLARAVDYLKLR